MSLYKGNNLISGHQVLYSTTGNNTDGAMTQNATTSELNNKANINLSNLSATGQAVIDGQWVDYSETIAENVSLKGSTNLSYTLSGLPTGGNYEVLLSSTVNTGNVSGNSAQLNVRSDLLTNYISLCGAGTRANGVIQSRSSVILPISSTRKVYVGRNTNNNGTFALYVRGYRRIGTNA